MNNFLAIALFLAATACQSKSGANQRAVNLDNKAEMATMKSPTAPQTAEETGPQPKQNQPSAVINRQFIRNAQLRIRVNDVTASGKHIELAVQKAGGQH